MRWNLNKGSMPYIIIIIYYYYYYVNIPLSPKPLKISDHVNILLFPKLLEIFDYRKVNGGAMLKYLL